MRERLLVRQPEDPWPKDPWEVRERLLVYQPEDPWEVRERLFRCFRGVSVTAGGLKRRQGVLDAASQTYFTGSESNVRHSGGLRGGPLSGDFGRLWKAVAEEITRNRCLPARGPVGGERTASCAPAEDPWPEDPWEVRERLLVYQPEDPWEVRERLFRCFRGVSVTAGGLKRG